MVAALSLGVLGMRVGQSLHGYFNKSPLVKFAPGLIQKVVKVWE